MNPMYLLFWLLKQISLRLWFKPFQISGQENIPKKGPFIIISNHSNAFMDPISLAIIRFRSVFFLTRGDIFKPGFLNWFFRSLHMLPIFRRRDGIENLKKNPITFKQCTQILNSGQGILLFPEGDCVQEKYLREFRPGIIQILEEYYTSFPDAPDVQIIPVGLNYSKFKRSKSVVYIEVGSPIFTKDSVVTNVNRLASHKQLLNTMHAKLTNCLLPLPSIGADALPLEIWLQQYRIQKTGLRFQFGFHLNNLQFKHERAIIKAYSLSPAHFPGSLRHITPENVGEPLFNTWHAVIQPLPYQWKDFPIEFCIACLRFFGYPMHLLSQFLGKYVANKLVREAEFWPSVRYGISFLVGWISFILLLSVLVIIMLT